MGTKGPARKGSFPAMDKSSQNTAPSPETGRIFGFVFLLIFLAGAVYIIGPEVLADTLRKVSGGLTTAEQVQLAAQEEAARLQAEAQASAVEQRAQIDLRKTREQIERDARDAQLIAKQKADLQRQIERRNLEDKERSQFLFARGDLDRLRLYLRDCTICDYQSMARAEVTQLEEQERIRQNPAVTFRLKSNHPNSVAYAFYSGRNSSRVWPGGVLASSNVQTERLSCEPGETVCYGAWVQGAFPSPFWGVGSKGKQPCSGCCLTCPTTESNVMTLEPRDARTPLPDITWNIAKNFGGTLALSFYSTLRQGHSWPGGDRVYVLDDQSPHQYGLNCMVGEKICYGAWFSGNPNGSYWGAGPGGRNSCATCCNVCNGGEYTTNLSLQNE